MSKAACCADPGRVCCSGECFPPGFLVETVPPGSCTEVCGCPDEGPLVEQSLCCAMPPEDRRRNCCDGYCRLSSAAIGIGGCENNLCGCPDDEPTDQEKCCAQHVKERVCCEGVCFLPGSEPPAGCEDRLCGCPAEEDGCCPPDYNCCNSKCSHNSIVNVWCGPPDAPTCCEVLDEHGEVPTVGPYD